MAIHEILIAVDHFRSMSARQLSAKGMELEWDRHFSGLSDRHNWNLYSLKRQGLLRPLKRLKNVLSVSIVSEDNLTKVLLFYPPETDVVIQPLVAELTHTLIGLSTPEHQAEVRVFIHPSEPDV